jgi:hypothetical protein
MAISLTAPAVFYPRQRPLILVAAPLIALLCVTQVMAGLESGEPWLNWLINLVLWTYLFVFALRRRLVLTEVGLEYADLLQTIHVPWAQVTRLDSRTWLWVLPIEGLQAWAGSPVPKEHFIELTQFSRRWRDGELGLTLRRWAPHLFPETPPAEAA